MKRSALFFASLIFVGTMPHITMAQSDNGAALSAMQKNVAKLQAQNRVLSKALTDATQKIASMQEILSAVENKDLRGIAEKLNEEKSENIQLKQDLERIRQNKRAPAQCPASVQPLPPSPPQEPQQNCSELKAQNASLRETIKAQNDYLLKADKSTQCQNKLALMERSAKSNAQQIQVVMGRNEKLEKEIANYKEELRKLQALREILYAMQEEAKNKDQATTQ